MRGLLRTALATGLLVALLAAPAATANAVEVHSLNNPVDCAAHLANESLARLHDLVAAARDRARDAGRGQLVDSAGLAVHTSQAAVDYEAGTLGNVLLLYDGSGGDPASAAMMATLHQLAATTAAAAGGMDRGVTYLANSMARAMGTGFEQLGDTGSHALGAAGDASRGAACVLPNAACVSDYALDSVDATTGALNGALFVVLILVLDEQVMVYAFLNAAVATGLDHAAGQVADTQHLASQPPEALPNAGIGYLAGTFARTAATVNRVADHTATLGFGTAGALDGSATDLAALLAAFAQGRADGAVGMAVCATTVPL